jgi:hypothetical protein
VTNGWRDLREINKVIYDPDLINIEEMVRILKEARTYRGTAQKL